LKVNMPRIVNKIQDFLRLETSAGFVLMFVALFALIANNSPLSGFYSSFLSTPVEVQFGSFEIAKPLLLWINDGLMAIFFFLVGSGNGVFVFQYVGPRICAGLGYSGGD